MSDRGVTDEADDRARLDGRTLGGGLLPEWYMPAPMAGAPLLRGWRRRVGLLIVASFVLINAFGLCSTYGRVASG